MFQVCNATLKSHPAMFQVCNATLKSHQSRFDTLRLIFEWLGGLSDVLESFEQCSQPHRA